MSGYRIFRSSVSGATLWAPWKNSSAGVAELVQAHGLGPCGGNPMEVRVLPPALTGQGYGRL